MPLIETLTVNVAGALAKVILKLWLKDEGPVAIGEGVIETLKKRFETYQEQRSGERLLRDLEDEIAPRLERFIKAEFPHMPENECMAAALSVADAIDHLRIVEALMRGDLDAIRLETAVHAAAPDAFAMLGRDTTDLADLLLRECCNYIVTIAPRLPRFEAEATRELLRRSTSILQEVGRVLDELTAIRIEAAGMTDRESAKFEDQYRRTLAHALDRVELFGAGLIGAALREYNLTRAYVPGSAIREGASEPCRVEEALAQSRRMIVKGDAGLGKTTLMQYLAVQAARKQLPGPLHPMSTRIPFYLRLREFRDAAKDFPTPAGFLVGPLADLCEIMPKGWAQRTVADRGLILIDGIDEVPAGRRGRLFEWLRGLHEAYPDTIIIISSRPAALEASEHVLGERLSTEGFSSITLEPMTLDDSDTLVVRWHAEISRGLPSNVALEALAEYERSLRSALRERPVIRSLASNPLLCSLICVLNWAQKKHLPDDRMELYRLALEMLLERREKEREIGAVYVEGLDRASKQTLLDGIAYWMLRNVLSEADRAEAEEQIASMLPRLAGLDAAPTLIMQELIERSGVLREPQHGTVDFVHRTFLEYMGARAALGQGDRDALVSRAAEESWRDVIVFAAGHAEGHARDELIERLLKRASPRRRSIDVEVTAACCLETVGRNLRPDLLQRLRDLARKLFPPNNFASARVLASAAANEPALLEGHARRSPAVVAACIRTATIVGTQRMLQVIASYAKVTGEIIDHEIARAYPMFDEQQFDRLVLQSRGKLFGVDLASLSTEEGTAFRLLLRYKRARQPSYLVQGAYRKFVRDRELDLTLFEKHDAVESQEDEEDKKARMLAWVQNRQLSQEGTTRTGMREITQIATLHSLSRLVLNEVEREAIPKLAQLTVHSLKLKLEIEADVGPLAKMGTLQHLVLSGKGITRLTALRACANLRDLSITDASEYSEIDCIGAGSALTQLEIAFSPLSSLAPVASAKDLEVLKLRLTPDKIPDFESIERLSRLHTLELWARQWNTAPRWKTLQALKHVILYGAEPDHITAFREVPSLTSMELLNYPSKTLDLVPEHLHRLVLWRKEDESLDLSTIGRFVNLTYFDTSRCVLENPDALLQLPALKEVWFFKSNGVSGALIQSLRDKGVSVRSSL